MVPLLPKSGTNFHSLLPPPLNSSSSASRWRRKMHRHWIGGAPSISFAAVKCHQTGPSPYEVLGVHPSCSFLDIKSAFRRKVKEFHPDVCKDLKESNAMIQHVIKAYEFLSKHHESEPIKSEHFDPFEEPECEATDVFVNETVCMGKGCPYSCIKKAPYVFSLNSETGTARANSQGYPEDYQVQLAVGQCPRRCIHYVTPSQRVVLEEILQSILDAPYDPAEVLYLESLIAKASSENNKYQKPKSQPKATTEFVDWY